jgi:cell division protein FtsX
MIDNVNREFNEIVKFTPQVYSKRVAKEELNSKKSELIKKIGGIDSGNFNSKKEEIKKLLSNLVGQSDSTYHLKELAELLPRKYFIKIETMKKNIDLINPNDDLSNMKQILKNEIDNLVKSITRVFYKGL